MIAYAHIYMYIQMNVTKYISLLHICAQSSKFLDCNLFLYIMHNTYCTCTLTDCTLHIFAGLLHNVFYHLYDVETIKETTFIDWLKRGTEDTGRGVALQSVKGFFDWLENADPESDNESGT